MKRFHVHVRVANLAKSIDFYSQLFGEKPTRVEKDYAKWMLEDPRINFAISNRSGALGIDHLGFQVDQPVELIELKSRARLLNDMAISEEVTTCCYAESEKHWVVDPQGIAWEHFHTLGNAPVFLDSDADPDASQSACCAPKSSHAQASVAAAKPASSCC